MHYDAVLFDAADTLFTTQGSVGEIYGEVARRHGCTASASEIQAAFVRQFRHSGPLTTENEKQWWKDLVYKVFSDVGMIPQFDQFFNEVYEKFRDSRGWRLFPETREVLLEMKDRGLKLGVVSNFDSRVYSVMKSLDILEFFKAVVISSETGYAKPHPEIFKTAVRSIEVPANRILFAGDNLEDDVLAARSVGIYAVLVDRSGHYDDLNSVPRVQDLRHLLPMIGDPA